MRSIRSAMLTTQKKFIFTYIYGQWAKLYAAMSKSSFNMLLKASLKFCNSISYQ